MHTSPLPDDEPDGAERRTSPRVPASAVPQLKARLLAGPDVRLVDLSRRGVLLETQTRLLPGSPIRLKFVADDATLVLKGSVVRSSVSTFGEQGLVYRTAVTFDQDISICDESLWVAAPAADPPAAFDRPNTGEFAIVPAANLDTDGDASAASTAAEPAAPGTTLITLFANDRESFRSMLADNDW
jgi:hypothetical protein